MIDELNISADPTQSFRIYRPHILDLSIPALWSLLMLLPALLIILAINAVGLADQPLLRAGEWLFGGLYLVFVISYLMMNVIFWYMDAWIFTPAGLMDIQLISLFNRRVAQLGWNQVQDVQVSTEGALASLFRYGNIRIQTAAKEGVFVMRAISNPRAVADLIGELSAASQQEHQSFPADANPSAPPSPPNNFSGFTNGE